MANKEEVWKKVIDFIILILTFGLSHVKKKKDKKDQSNL